MQGKKARMVSFSVFSNSIASYAFFYFCSFSILKCVWVSFSAGRSFTEEKKLDNGEKEEEANLARNSMCKF